jgi:hypothetical protein
VHSKRSLAAVVDRTLAANAQHTREALLGGPGTEKPSAGDAELRAHLAATGGGAVLQPPVVVELRDLGPALAEKRALIQLLPYQHRNPAV